MISYQLRTVSLLTFLSIVFLLTFTFAQASTIVRSGEVVSLSEDQTVEGDFYGAAGTVNLSGEVTEDASLVGGQVTLNGLVGANAFLVGGGVDVYGEVGDDLRIVSGEIKVADKVKGDLMVVGGSVYILPTATIEGDVLIYAGEAIIEGAVGGDVLGAVGTLRIDSDVAGDININVTELTLGSNANIQGAVGYTSASLAIQAQEANVVGDIVRSDPIIPQNEGYSWSWIAPSLMLLFSSLVWYLVSRKTLNVVVSRSMKDRLRHMMVGFGFIVLVPVAVLLLFISVIGTFVALPLMFGYLLFLSLGIIGLVPVIGKYMMVAFSKSESSVTPLLLFGGAIGFGLLSMVPMVGEVILALCIILIIGTVIDALVIRAEYK